MHLALLRRELGYQLPPKEAYKKAISGIAGVLHQYQDSPFQPEKHIRSSIYKGPLSITVLEATIDRAVKSTELRFHWKQNADEIPVKNLNYIAKSLYIYWKGVSEVFTGYWGGNPKDQRLFCAMGLYTMTMFFDKVIKGIDVNSAFAVEEVKKRLQPIRDIPWSKMLVIPSTPKATLRPEHLFDVINDLWQKNGARPYTLVITESVSKAELTRIELL